MATKDAISVERVVLRVGLQVAGGASDTGGADLTAVVADAALGAWAGQARATRQQVGARDARLATRAVGHRP